MGRHVRSQGASHGSFSGMEKKNSLKMLQVWETIQIAEFNNCDSYTNRFPPIPVDNRFQVKHLWQPWFTWGESVQKRFVLSFSPHEGLTVNCLFGWSIVTEEQKAQNQTLKNWRWRLEGNADKSRTSGKHNPNVSFPVPIDCTWSAETQPWRMGSAFCLQSKLPPLLNLSSSLCLV